MVGGIDNGRQKTRNHGYDVIVGGELFNDYPITFRNRYAKPKTQINRRRTLPASFLLWMPRAATQKDFSLKSQDAVALQQIKERGALPMIDQVDIRQAIDRCSNIWASLPGAGYGLLKHKADSLMAPKKRAERSERLMYSRVMIISALVIWIIVCLSWAVNHYRDNAITAKPSATKMPEN